MTFLEKPTFDQTQPTAQVVGKKSRRISPGSILPIQGVQKRQKKKLTVDEQEHLIDLFSSRWYSVAELNRIEKESGIKYKRGKFSNAEARVIDEAVQKHIAEHNTTFKEFKEEFFDRRGHRRLESFFLAAAQQLPGRPVVHVYHYLRRQYHPGNWQGRWSEDEDEQLKRLFAVYGPQWEMIGEQVGRFHTSCKDRYRVIRQRFNSGRWSEEEVGLLRQGILAWRQEKPQDCAVWAWIAAKVGTRSWMQCLTKYTTSLEAQMRQGHNDHQDGKRSMVGWSDEEDLLLIHKIYDLVVEDESEIIWSQLLDANWKHRTSTCLHRRWLLLRRRVHRERHLDMDTILETLMQSIRSPSVHAAPEKDAELLFEEAM